MWSEIWNGIKYVVVNGIKISIEAATYAWEVLKFITKLTVWTVAGVFTVGEHLFGYVSRMLNNLVKPSRAVIIPPSKLPSLANYIEDQMRTGGVSVDPEAMDVVNRVKEAAEEGQSLLYGEGKDDDGNETIIEPTFVSASSYEGKIQEAVEQEKIYIKNVIS